MAYDIQPTFGSIQNPYQEFEFTIQPNAREKLYYAFNYFRILTLTGGTISVRLGASGAETSVVGAGIGIRLDDVVNFVDVINSGGTAVTVRIALAIGTISDDRLNVSGNVSVVNGSTLFKVASSNNVIQDNSAVVVSNASTVLIFNADANTTGGIIFNNSGNTIFVGQSSTLATLQTNGIPILPNASYSFDGSYDLYACSTAGTTNDARVMRVGSV